MTQENIPLQPNEEIKSIQGYEGLYSITSFGRVWSHRREYIGGNGCIRRCGERFLKSGLNGNGYLNVVLFKNGKSKTFGIHCLVGAHYLLNPFKLPQINHKDTYKQNNFVDNLEWCTNQDNQIHAIKNKLKPKNLSKYYGVSYSNDINRIKKWRAFVRIENKVRYLGRFLEEIDAAKAYNKYIINNNLNKVLNEGI